MAVLVVGRRGHEQAARARKQHPGCVVAHVRKGVARASAGGVPRAEIAVAVRDRALAAAIEQEIVTSLRTAFDERERMAPMRPVTIRSRKEVSMRRPEIAGAIAIVPIDPPRHRSLPALVAALEDAGAAGIQLVVGRRRAMPPELEATLFALLEAHRGSKKRCPLLLARTDAPSEIWYFQPDAVARATAAVSTWEAQPLR